MAQQKFLTDKLAVKSVFQSLRKEGYKARMNYKCCQSCGWSAMSNEYQANGDTPAVFFHKQDAEAFDDNNNLKSMLYLAWQGDGEKIKTIVEQHGLQVEWNGSNYDRIGIKPRG